MVVLQQVSYRQTDRQTDGGSTYLCVTLNQKEEVSLPVAVSKLGLQLEAPVAQRMGGGG